jgi:hypothetical protein
VRNAWTGTIAEQSTFAFCGIDALQSALQWA